MSEEYIKYQSVKKLADVEVQGILDGKVYVFPKIDGTNAQVWFDGNEMHYGSRRRELSIENDNANFMNEICRHDNLIKFCKSNPDLRVFGEWLVPHSLKAYRENAWRHFYIFDMANYDEEREMLVYIHYDLLSSYCEEFNLEYIPPIKIINNPSEDNIYRELENNNFLIEDGKGCGEGVVLKNYDYYNKYGRMTWAKVITSEFKEKMTKTMGAPQVEGEKKTEEAIVIEYVTNALIEKTIAKITLDTDGWRSEMIPRLIGTVYHDLVTEHIWDICKKFKNPTIDFRRLSRFCTMKIKQSKPDIF